MDRSETFTQLCALVCDAQDGKSLEPLLVKIRDVNEVDREGYSPVWYAVMENEQISVIETLLKAGSKVTVELVEEAVVHNANIEITKLLFSHLENPEQEDIDLLFLMAAASNTHDLLVRFFVAQGADITSTLPMDLYPSIPPQENDFISDEDDYWWDDSEAVMQNAIVVAIYENPDPAPMVKTLIDLGVDPNWIDREGFSVLIHALDNAELVNTLLENGVQIDVQDSRGMTALMHACAADSSSVSLALLAAKSDVHLTSLDGETALHFALGCHLHDNSEVVEALLKAGSDFNAPDGAGRLPLDIARFNYCSQNIIEMLVQAGAKMGDLS